MRVIKCKCGSNNLKAKWNSKTGEKWIMCDDCGNISTAIITNDADDIIKIWNREQSEPITKRST